MNPEQPESPRPSPDRKLPSWGGNVVWYLLGIVIITLFLFSQMEPGSQVELSYMDLVRLIEQGPPQVNRQAAIEVRESVAGKEEVAPLLQPGQPQVRPARNHRHRDSASGRAARRPRQGRTAGGPLQDPAAGTGERQQRPVQSG